MLREVTPFEKSQPSITANVFVNNTLLNIKSVIRRVKELLADS